MVSYLLVAGATLLELLCTIFVINGLVGEKPAYPAVWIKMIYLGITIRFYYACTRTVVKWKLYFSVSFCLFSV